MKTIDFTELDYFGIREDPMIKGTIKGPGTTKMRHYLGFSIERNINCLSQ